ncbi:hypothetical protein MK079_02210 [Candidatus Gracilibacteria bacterium]|nr:hypothetical protein [Candidatus Gracilibacteria bacterium]
MSTPKLSKNPTQSAQEKVLFSDAIKETGDQGFTEDQIKEFKDILLTKEHIGELKAGKMTVEKLTRLKLSQHKDSINTTQVEKNLKKSAEILKKGDKDQESTLEKLEATTNEALAGVKNTKVTQKATEGIKKVKESGMMNFSWEKLESIPFIGGFFKIIGKFFGWLKGLFNFGDKTSEKVQELRETLSPQEIIQTKQQVAEKIESDILGSQHIHPLVQQRLKEVVNDPNIINEENLLELKEKIEKNGNIELVDIQSILTPEKYSALLKTIMGEEERQAQLDMTKTHIINEIYDTYGLDVGVEKRETTKHLVDELFEKQNIQSNELIQEKLLKGEIITLGEILSAMSESAIDASWFFLKLVGTGVISGEKLASNFYASGSDMVVMSIGALPGLTPSISVEELSEQVSQMEDHERRLLMGILYRQSGALAYFAGKSMGFLVQSTTEVLSQTPETSWKMGTQSWQNIEKQNASYRNLEKHFGISAGSQFLEESMNHLKTLRTNNSLISIIQDASQFPDDASKIQHVKKEIQKLGNNFDQALLQKIGNISSTRSFNDFRSGVANSIAEIPVESIFKIGSENIPKGLTQYSLEMHKYHFVQNINTIQRYQRQALSTGIPAKVVQGLRKIPEMFANMELSRNMQHINFEGLSKKEALSRTQALGKMAKDMPDLFRSMFGGGLTLAFFGVDIANSKDSVVESILDSSAYILNVLGPGKLILNMGTSLSENGKLEWHEIAAGGAGGILLGIDATNLAKIAVSSDTKGNRILRAGKYIIRPITDIGSFGVNVVKTGVNIADVIKSRGQISIKDAIKNGFSTQKRMGLKGRALIFGSLLAAGYFGYEAWADDFPEEYEELVKTGIIDKQGNPLKTYGDITQLSDTQKEVLTEIFFQKYAIQETTDLRYIVKNSRLTIISHNPQIQDYIIYQNDTLLSQIKNVLGIGVENISFQNT